MIDIASDPAAENLIVDWLPIETYMRLWLPKVFGERYRRILYLDYDTLVVTDQISRLMDIDMGHHALAAVRDKAQWRTLNKPVHDFKRPNIGGKRYFNAGVQLFDTAAFNAQGLHEAALAIPQNYDDLRFHDQSLLNLVLQGEFAEISPVWNWHWVTVRPYLHDFMGVRVIHLANRVKPWEDKPGQEKFPLSFGAEYTRFLDTHFPDQVDRGHFRHRHSAKRGDHAKLLFDHLVDLWTLYRYKNRFKDDFDVIL